MKLGDRFWSKVDFLTSDIGCWLWTSATNPKGYGGYWLDGRNQAAHRLAYIDTVGPIPDGLQLDHLCRNHACVSPAHLEPVTSAENQLRAPHAKNHPANSPHCNSGHPWSENLRTVPSGRVYCAECNRLNARRIYAQKRAS